MTHLVIVIIKLLFCNRGKKAFFLFLQGLLIHQMKLICLERFSDVFGAGLFSDKTSCVQYEMDDETRFGQKK